jgi:hypothetical protein
VTIAALVFGLFGFITGWTALRTLASLRKSVALLQRGTSGKETIVEVAEKHVAASEAVRKDVLELQRDMVAAQTDLTRELTTQQSELQQGLAETQSKIEKHLNLERKKVAKAVHEMQSSIGSVLRRVALVRYDAFDDLGGRLSFSLAIMDDNGDGITLTSIASPTESRLYAKSLSGGIGEHALSPEEEQAVRAAMSR